MDLLGLLSTITSHIPFKSLLGCVLGKNKLKIEKLPSAAEIIPLDASYALLILHLRIINPTDAVLVINEVECKSLHHPNEVFEPIPPHMNVNNINDDKILDRRDMPLNRRVKSGSVDVFLVRRCNGVLAHHRVKLKIVITDHRSKSSKLECEVAGIYA